MELGRELRATLAATVRDDGATSTGTHAQTESMGFGATPVVRLKRALTHNGSKGKWRAERTIYECSEYASALAPGQWGHRRTHRRVIPRRQGGGDHRFLAFGYLVENLALRPDLRVGFRPCCTSLVPAM